ncbi:unnamed protein product [Ambrosiozyma monospora]|uniref:DNA polymerase gamma n=1 Tax=Ambrosiozyma monospora TaxID=43982 RepID=A0A9W7DHS5_AMBMO|nr:unnamed protein product [Ambrosiozyma monospora]
MHLKQHELLGKKCSSNIPINFPVPSLQGKNLSEHFYRVGAYSIKPYMTLIENLLAVGQTIKPTIPTKWEFKSGWTRYEVGKPPKSVPYPLEDELVFDVETMYHLTQYPCIATCYTPKAWYSWCSPYLTGESKTQDGHLIPLGVRNHNKIVVGHNVSYDRARVLEEYSVLQSKAFYLDTMSLHVAVSGMCSRQRGTWLKYKKNGKKSSDADASSLDSIRDSIVSEELRELIDNPILDKESTDDPLLSDDPWMKTSSMNSLAHVAELHCGIKMDKEIRDDFKTEDPDEIRNNFQKLMTYCANDVVATTRVFNKIFKDFRKLVPHPASLAALRHINQSFLPTTRAWEKYIHTTEDMYQKSAKEIESKLHFICNEVVKMKDNEEKPWEKDPWLSQLDWTIAPVKLTKKGVPYKSQKLPGYPEWYKKLVVKGQLNLTTRTRTSALLLKLSWEGNPIYWLDSKGWCFVVDKSEIELYKSKNYTHYEDEQLYEKPEEVTPELLDILRTKCFFKIPHENGPNSRTTNLMSKPFIRHLENNLLSSEFDVAREALQLAVSNSYWTSSRERIMNQFVVFNDDKNLDKKVDFAVDSKMGAIIPQVVSMGTITRRVVEKTWLTASNAKKNRLGSELKTLVQAPKGYCFVGADVDSEELWIASLVGDSIFKMHGGTAIGWMTLEGTKSEGTDLHSKTAKILGISRNEAKVFNYGRIYGAGQKFATTLLKKFNPTITDAEASKTSKALYSATKGRSNMLEGNKIWYGGSETVVFNRLEQIAEQEHPLTPVLGAGITSALQRKNLKSNTFLPSRINWAIQSSGVDYLHLLLVSMEYLTKLYNVDARMCISIHDEIRYMVKEEDRYKCGMLLQIANLWTRAMFCHQLGIDEVPHSCAFFSAVDFDHILRKEVDLDCITPSNPNPIPHGESLDVYQILAKSEVQQMLNSNVVNNIDLSDIKYKKTKRPTELLDSELDPATMVLWIRLQLCQKPKEFKTFKGKFLDNLKLKQDSEYVKTLGHDNLTEEVVCEEDYYQKVKDCGFKYEEEGRRI